MPAHRLIDEGFPVFAVAPNSTQITQEMIEKAFEEEWTELAPAPLLRDSVPIEGVNLDDTSSLWELE